MPDLEHTIEDRLIKQLSTEASQWTYCPELNTEDKLWANLRNILVSNNIARLDGMPLNDQEFEQVKNQLSFASFYAAAEWLVGENGRAHVYVQRDNERIPLVVLNRAHVAGGSSVYQIIHQYQALKTGEDARDRRFDVTLLINGLPLIHIELKNQNHSYMEAFRQIKKYIAEGKFTGIFSTLQMFVVSNVADTKYIPAARADELNDRFLIGWVNHENERVPGLFDFANAILRIPQAHEMITQYSVLDKERRKIILLRPYQIQAIEAVRDASRHGESGFIWHTTGSGKTLTSYKCTRNLLQDIPSIEKTLFLIDRKDLDTQTTQAFESYAATDVVDVKGTENVDDLIKKLNCDAHLMIVTTIQKLQILMERLKRTKEKFPKRYERICSLKCAFVVDECHRAVTPSTKKDIEAFFQQGLWYGFTGTPRFPQNPYPVLGELPRTSEELYGSCLHKYTIKDAIHDGAVLGFQVERFGPEGLKTDAQGNNVDEDMSVYETETHMRKVLEIILAKSYDKLGIRNGAGNSYEAILSCASIRMAQQYYELLKQMVSEEPSVIDPRICRVLPDFPKFAITYSVGENDESAQVNQQKMQDSLADYNALFGKHYTLTDIAGYNADLNNRLARKYEKFMSRSEQLDLVIVVDRLLTGFDAPSMSMVVLDRQPMQLHTIIQTFSRTNRILDKNKSYGQIVTCQSPGTFKNTIDTALELFSAGGYGDALAPSWEEAEEKFKQSLAALRAIAPTPASVTDMPKTKPMKELRLFVRLFQHFDSAFAQLKAYTNYQDKDLAADYGITEEEYTNYVAMYENAREWIRPEPSDPPDDDPIDTEYELKSYGVEQIDYEYIVRLIQAYVASASSQEEDAGQTARKAKEITTYIDSLSRTNPKLGALMAGLWTSVQADPERYRNEDVLVILQKMREEIMDKAILTVCAKWCLKEEPVRFSAKRFRLGMDKLPGEKEIADGDNFERYIETHNDTRKFQYRKDYKADLMRVFAEEILPLRDPE